MSQTTDTSIVIETRAAKAVGTNRPSADFFHEGVRIGGALYSYRWWVRHYFSTTQSLPNTKILQAVLGAAIAWVDEQEAREKA